MSAMTEAISVAVTAKVMEQLKDSGIIPRNGLNAATSTTYRVIFEQYNQTPEQDITNEGHQTPMTINAPKIIWLLLPLKYSQINIQQMPKDNKQTLCLFLLKILFKDSTTLVIYLILTNL
jgi:hypothetical protein